MSAHRRAPRADARRMVAAVGAGAAIAGGASAAPTSESPTPPPLAAAVHPVTGLVNEDAHTRALIGTGGDGLAKPDFAAARAAEARVDVDNLVKAADIGTELVRQAELLRAALAEGAPRAALRGGRAFALPVDGRLTSAAGPRGGAAHHGLDIANRIGTPIFAVTDGVVEEAGPASGFGLWVVLRHPDGTASIYGHINQAFVEVGQQIAAGERIAEVGNRGQSTGPHLHLEIWDPNGTKIDPMTWLRRRGVGA